MKNVVHQGLTVVTRTTCERLDLNVKHKSKLITRFLIKHKKWELGAGDYKLFGDTASSKMNSIRKHRVLKFLWDSNWPRSSSRTHSRNSRYLRRSAQIPNLEKIIYLTKGASLFIIFIVISFSPDPNKSKKFPVTWLTIVYFFDWSRN